MKLFGIVRYSPEQIASGLIKKLGYTENNIMYFGLGSKLSDHKKIPKVLMFLNYQDFLNNARELNDKKYNRKLVFVYTCAEKLYGYKGITVLDCIEHRTARFVEFEDCPIDWTKIENAKSSTVERDSTFIDTVKEAVKQGSILNQLMTVIYTIKKPHNQKGATLYICRWLVEKQIRKIPVLLKEINRDYELTPANNERLKGVLLDPIVKNFKKVFLKLKADHSNLEDLCSHYGIPPFEVRYILAKINNEVSYSDKSKRNIDELVDT